MGSTGRTGLRVYHEIVDPTQPELPFLRASLPELEAVSPEEAGLQAPGNGVQVAEAGHIDRAEREHPGDNTAAGGACAPAVVVDPGGPQNDGLWQDGGPAVPEEEEIEVEEDIADKPVENEVAPKVVRVPRVPTQREWEIHES